MRNFSALIVIPITILAGTIIYTFSAEAAQEDLDIQQELMMPGVKLLVVEFYATWCTPCMESVPKWKALHEKYKKEGLRFVVVSADDEVCSKPPEWSPDRSLCDSNGVIRRKFEASELPLSLLYSWEGNIAMRSHRVEAVEEVVENYFRNTQFSIRVAPVEVFGDKYAISSNPEWVRTEVISRLVSRSKFKLVTSADTPIIHTESSTCPSGFPANSVLRIRLTGDETGGRFLSLQLEKDSCVKASSQERYTGKDMQEDKNSLSEASRVATDRLIAQIITVKEAETIDKGVTFRTFSNQFDDDGSKIKNPIVDQKGYLFIDSDPSGAEVIINGEQKGQTPYQAELMVGDYVIKCEKGALWIPAQKRIKMSKDGAELRMSLGPYHGNLQVESYPTEADISLNGESTGQRTPYTFTMKKAGDYNVLISRELYLSKAVKVRLGDGKTTIVSERLEPQFGVIEVNSIPDEADISLNGEPTGEKTPFIFPAKKTGDYSVTLSKKMYLSKTIQVRLGGGNKTIISESLEPNFGSIKIESMPQGASIAVDGADTGLVTPTVIKSISVGLHDIILRLQSHNDYKKKVKVEKAQTADLKAAMTGRMGLLKFEAWQLMNGAKVAARASVLVNNKNSCTTPCKKEVLIGNYEITINGGDGSTHKETVIVDEGKEYKIVADLKEEKREKVAPFVLASEAKTEQSIKQMKTYGPIGTFGGMAFIGLGGVFSYLASTHRDSLYTAKNSTSMSEAKDLIDQYNRLAVAGYVTGVALMASGIIVWAVGASLHAHSQTTVNLNPVIMRDFAGLGASGVW